MSRSKWKGNFIEKSLLNKEKNKLWSRSSTVPESMIGNFVLIHNGKEFKKVLVIREKVGFKFGDFSFTRKYTSKIKSSKIVQTKKKKS
jgi:small subunit ribosomal protein S19